MSSLPSTVGFKDFFNLAGVLREEGGVVLCLLCGERINLEAVRAGRAGQTSPHKPRCPGVLFTDPKAVSFRVSTTDGDAAPDHNYFDDLVKAAGQTYDDSTLTVEVSLDLLRVEGSNLNPEAWALERKSEVRKELERTERERWKVAQAAAKLKADTDARQRAIRELTRLRPDLTAEAYERRRGAILEKYKHLGPPTESGEAPATTKRRR